MRRTPNRLLERTCRPHAAHLGGWTSGRRGATSQLAFRLSSGDTVVALGGKVHVERLGEILVTRPIAHREPGETLLTFGFSDAGSFPALSDARLRG